MEFIKKLGIGLSLYWNEKTGYFTIEDFNQDTRVDIDVDSFEVLMGQCCYTAAIIDIYRQSFE